MKIRTGFVSNSSSSSFVCITTKQNFKETIKKCHPYVAAVGKEVFSKGRFTGMDVMVYTDYCDMGGNSYYDHLNDNFDFDGDIPDNEEGEEMEPWEAIEIFTRKLQENNESEVLTDSRGG